MTDLYDEMLARIRGESALLAMQTLTVPDMARLLGLTETTIRTYATARQYIHLLPRPFKRPGGRRLLWDADEVRAWLAAGRPPSIEKPRKQRGRPSKTQQVARARLREQEASR